MKDGDDSSPWKDNIIGLRGQNDKGRQEEKAGQRKPGREELENKGDGTEKGLVLVIIIHLVRLQLMIIFIND